MNVTVLLLEMHQITKLDCQHQQKLSWGKKFDHHLHLQLDGYICQLIILLPLAKSLIRDLR